MLSHCGPGELLTQAFDLTVVAGSVPEKSLSSPLSHCKFFRVPKTLGNVPLNQFPSRKTAPSMELFAKVSGNVPSRLFQPGSSVVSLVYLPRLAGMVPVRLSCTRDTRPLSWI